MDKPTSIKIGSLEDKKSLKSKLTKKASKKGIKLHTHIINTLNTYGV